MRSPLSAPQVRAQLAFDVERLRAAAGRLERVDASLSLLRARLEQRSTALAGEAMGWGQAMLSGDGGVQILRSQAQATAQLARRAALGEVLRSSSRVSLVAAMAVSRWLAALRALAAQRASESVLRGHVEAGRLAHRLLAILRPREALRSGLGQLVAAVLVAELAHPDNAFDVEQQIVEGLSRARSARGVRTDLDAVSAASSALRAAARLLEELADEAEPAARALTDEADGVEARIAAELRRAAAGHSPSAAC